MLYCITDTDVGGAERFLLRLLRHLPRDNVSAEVVSLLPEGQLAREIRELGIPVRHLDISFLRSGAALTELRRILTHGHWDVLHSILVHGNLAARLAKLGLAKPRVISSVRVAERGKIWQLRAEQFTWRLSNLIVAVSESVAAFLRRAGIARSRIRVIPNSVDPSEVSRARPVPRNQIGVGDNSPLILFVGRLHRQKGVDVLLRAMADLVSCVPEAVLLVVGEGPEGARLKQLASQLRIADRVRWLGWQPNPLGLMKTADVLAMPSRWEGMPNAVLEAMAVGTPVVGTAVDGITELLRQGRGVLVPPDNPPALGRALVNLLSDSKHRRRIADAALRYVLAYPPQEEARHYLALYQQVARSGTKRRLPT